MKKTALSALAALALAFAPAVAFAQDNPGPADPALTQVVNENEEIAPLGTPVELDAGHADLGPKYLDGKWTFMVRDDTKGAPVWRHLEDVVFRVHDKAKLTLPKDPAYDFIKASGDVYAIPQTEAEGVIWLGWNTQDPAVVKKLGNGVSLVYGGHQGEGDLNVFVQAGNFAGPTQLWNSAKNEAQPIHVDPNTHTHANWVFTKPGTHLVRLTAQARLADGSSVEDAQVLRFAVGDGADAKDAASATWTEKTEPSAKASVEAPSAVDKSTSLPLYVGAGLAVAVVVIVGVVVVLKRRAAADRAAAAKAVEE
ncbi:surface-anchored protein [Arcanobacterium wilhelmae]|uniref:Surface-anchored protein n=1 Tax=Arcanobacterium wilhelmae TaxID=1803177 RepID=A0ABT9N9Y4_9ACTO|nr:choice-of-anchor M domain-containing protein [Arcanobacterium wilhelmae]MDP9800527.1 surface-anchored protein [Arcanobacterium wilhelmae]WFN89944.1 choice-of-anchor M domain-containing protein [Arcanobacterium wilhelmae]